MTQIDRELATDFVQVCSQRIVGRASASRFRSPRCRSLHSVILILAMRRFCLFLLDHYASDVSSDIFRHALLDPVASVRESALHGVSGLAKLSRRSFEPPGFAVA